MFQIIIDIADLNDNAPEFPQSVKVIDISEAAQPGDYFSLPLATDPDSPTNGVRSYELVTWSSVFRLADQLENDGSRGIGLVLMDRCAMQHNITLKRLALLHYIQIGMLHCGSCY